MAYFNKLDWKIRVKKHYLIRAVILLFCKFIFYRYIADKSIVQLQNRKDGFDRYSYCKEKMKDVCPIGKKVKYMLYIKYYGYMFYGEDELACYIEALRRFYSLSPLVFPHSKKWTKKSGEEYIA